MEMLVCINCLHPCHCKGVGPTPNTAQCLTVPGCNCLICNHQIIKEDDMAKKIIKWVWDIVSWPFKKVKDWLWSK